MQDKCAGLEKTVFLDFLYAWPLSKLQINLIWTIFYYSLEVKQSF